MRFNRTSVELKYLLYISVLRSNSGFNRTSVELKSILL